MNNCQALCGPCNREKGNRETFTTPIPEDLEVWPSDGKLRSWQQAALRVAVEGTEPILIEACPGAGKTRFAQEVAYALYNQKRINRVLVVVPTARLVAQWVQSCNEFSDGSPKLPMAPPTWTPIRPIYDTEVGAAFTYQALFANPLAFEALAAEAGFRTLVILDEVHHLGNESGWGLAAQSAFFGSAAFVIGLSGTAFRTRDRISFVTYDEHDRAVADYAYTYGQALSDGVCRPIEFHFIGGTAEFETPSGDTEVVDFEDDLNDRGRSYRLRTVLDLRDADGGWMRHSLDYADQQLNRIRQTDKDAGGLVVAMDIAHAHQVADLLNDISGERPTLAASRLENPSDPRPSRSIETFDHGRSKWIVAVKMISEGVDIRRLRVLTYATNITAELAFRQIIGRVVRSDSQNETDFGIVVLPADPSLRTLAERVSSEASISLIRDITIDDKTPTRFTEIRSGGNTIGDFRPLSATGDFDSVVATTDGSIAPSLVSAVRRYLETSTSQLDEESVLRLAEQDPYFRDALLAKSQQSVERLGTQEQDANNVDDQ